MDGEDLDIEFSEARGGRGRMRRLLNKRRTKATGLRARQKARRRKVLKSQSVANNAKRYFGNK